MNLSVGIVGLPNVGKSTLFNALLKQQVALAANYPFATIEPNVGIAQVPDARLAVLAQVVHTSVLKPATVEFVDIAGLVKGASTGEGLGNQFLSHIRETSAICHVLRGFTDNEIIREGSVSPKEDLEIIRTELQLADLATVDKQPQPKGSTTPEQKERWDAVVKFKTALSEGKMVNTLNLSPEEQLIAKELNLLTAKSEIFAINVDEDKLGTDGYSTQLGVNPQSVVVVSARIESELSTLSEEDQKEYMKELGIEKSGLERLAETAYATLGLQSFLTAGELEVRAWTITKGTTAPQAAGVIHTDFIKKFIKANIASFEDFITLGGWKGVKEAGKMRIEGKEYVMREGDVVEFMIGS
ncbi:MAG: redox-regulated ATPase YchF [Candidatus Woesebacteria bacterium]